MNFSNKTGRKDDVGNSRTAAKIAARIISLQMALASRINHRINSYNIKKQYAVLLTIIALITSCLIVSLIVDPWKMPLNQRGIPIPSYIGAASERPVLADSSIKKDSLIHQK